MQFNMKSNGSAQMDTRMIRPGNPLSGTFQQQPTSNCGAPHAARDCVVVRLARSTEHEHRAIQRRYIATAAKANARRRTVINAAINVFVMLSIVAAAYTLHQEQRLQQMEHAK